MGFDALELSLELIHSLREPVAQVRRHDAELASQLRRAASSVSLNLAEGRKRVGKDRLHHFRIAAGSAGEARTALRVATAWGHLDSNASQAPLALLDRLLAMLWRLTH